MICKHCARGGDLLAELPSRQAAADAGGKLYSNQLNGLKRRINNAHRNCPGGSWCDCAHAGTPHERRAAKADPLPGLSFPAPSVKRRARRDPRHTR